MEITLLDYLVFFIFVGGVALFGCSFYFRSRKGAAAFTAAEGSLPTWVVGMSIFATFVSSISFLGLPGDAYKGNWNPFVFSLSIPIATWLAAKVFIPLYRGIDSVSAYHYLEMRFGYWARCYVAVCYLLTQLARVGSILLLLALPLLLGSCEAYLDVNPKSEVTDKELFSTAEGCEDAIYGIYTEMGTNKNLFAYALTFAYPELMTGNFTISQSDNLAYVVQRLWEHENAITVAENLWINGYKAIGYVNKALMHVLPKSDDEFRHIRLYKGELLALRAYLHFEMARIFAVPFASGDAAAKAKAIPYVTTYGIEVTPYSSLDKVFELIVADLTEAEKYLAADEELVTATRDNASDGFTSCRITHLNLYAVQALLARAYWTMGKLDLAEDYAEKVIDSGKFPLMTTAEAWNAVETGTLNMQETVFGLYSTQYTYNFYRNHIYQGGTLALSSQYSEIYSTDLAGTDKRYSTWFDTGNSWCIKHYNKMYAQGESNPTYSGKSIPGPSLIRIPEMYYIVAEANLTKDPDKATEYLDYVVKSRDLTPFAERETGKITENNIINERRKEFFADGEDFFNMKRLQLDIAIPGGNFAGTDDATYTMPIPQSVEDNYRQ